MKGAKGSRLCLVCEEFDFEIPSLAVDRGTRDEGNLLCPRHRALAKEGYCVLCGRRAPTVRVTVECSFGCCRPCHFKRQGDGMA